MSVSSASSTASFTADEIILAESLGSKLYRIANFSKTVNLAIGGVGGMDVGSVPDSGFIAVYAIYNPTTNTSALLAVNATSALVPEVYGGVNMPSGYTASTLVGIWRVISGQFTVGHQINRHVSFPLITVYSTSIGATAISSLSFSAAVPKNATMINGYLTIYQNQVGSGIELSLYSSTSGIGQLRGNATVTGQTSASIANGVLHIIDSQTLYYNMANTYGQYGIGCTGYKF